jgi:hypothetical protein
VIESFYRIGLVTALASLLAGCGAQISTLRKSTLVTSGASGVPPALTSLTVVDASPTNHSPLTLQWGIVVGAQTEYCLIENATDPALCIWHSGVLPTTYTDSAADGPFALTAYLKNDFGVSEATVSNAVLIDRTAPVLASAVVGNSNPTNNPVFSLSYGAISYLPYAEFCLLENTASAAGCSWVPGSLPSSFTVSSGIGSKAISIWLRDAAGNISNRVTTAAILYDSTVPTVGFLTPAAGAYVNAANVGSFTVTGTCSDNGRNVVISGAASATVVCAGGGWTTNLDLSAAAEGAITLRADLTNAAGTAAVQATRGFVKDTILPTVAFTAPAAGSFVNSVNVASYAVSGACSENGRTVTISGAATGTATCSAGAWTTNLNFTAAASGAVLISADLSDAAGNVAATVTRSFTKDVTPPTVAFTSPAAGSVINSVNMTAFAVSGTCSENGRNVVLSGSLSATAVCGGGTWNATLDFSSVSDGAVTLTANHSDAAGNTASPASLSLTKSTGIPAVAITSPAAGSFVNIANVASFAVSGTCSENGRNVVISGDATATIACASGVWSTNLNFTAAAAGTVTIHADHSDAAANPAPQATRTFTKDVTAPTLAISTPVAGSFVNFANAASFTVTGTCSENGQNVVITGSATATLACASGAWSTSLNFTGAADGAVSITVNHSDAAGNAATPVTRAFVKDTVAPTIAITSPASGAFVNATNQAAFAVSGTCSENGQNVVLSGAGSASVACSGGTWNTTIDVSAAADGSITVYVNHSDAAGNPATPDSRNFTKDASAPTVAISSPAAASYVNAANVTAVAVTGTCSENTRNVVISGSASLTTVCASGAWSANLDFSGAADGTVTINVNHSDAAGNPATTATRSFTKDSTPPTLASMAITNSSPTNNQTYGLSYGSQTGTFTSYCVLENDTTLADCSAVWVSSASLPASYGVSASQNTKALTIWLRDAAGNVSTAVTSSNSVLLDTVAPVVTLTSMTGGQYFAGGSAQAVTETVTDANLGSNPLTVSYSTDGGGTWTALVSAVAYSGSNPWTLPSIDSTTVQVKVTAVDQAGNSTTVTSANFTIDSTPPVLTASQLVLNGGTTPTLTNYIPVMFQATDTAAPVNGYCLKYNSTTAPLASDTCWVGITPASSFSANVNYRLGFASGSYSVYAWARNSAGLISGLTNSGAGTVGQDKGTIVFSPVAPPALTGVTASAVDGSVNLTITSGSDVYIKWNASSTGTLAGSPITIFYTTDDTNYTAIGTTFSNAVGAGCTLSGGQTGCYKWAGGSPTSTYYRIRVGAIDTNGRQSYQASQPINVGTKIQILAGATDPGTGGSGSAAYFGAGNYPGGTTPDTQSFVVTTAGVIYFADGVRGILKVDPNDGVQSLIIPKTGVTGIDGAVPGATVRNPLRLSFDSQSRLLIFDYDRIRRYDPVGNTLTTIIGGGVSSAATVAPLSLQFSTNYNNAHIFLYGAADGKIYFQSENYKYILLPNYGLRVYDPGTNQVTTKNFSGTGDGLSSSQDLSQCYGGSLSGSFNSVTGAPTKFVVSLGHGPAACPGSGNYYSMMSPTTLQATGPFPNTYVYDQDLSIGADGTLFQVSRAASTIRKFDPSTQTFSTIVGTGSNGTCADGTLATSCAVDPSDAFTDANGKFYYYERGKIRTVDQSNLVYTVTGSGLFTGDGGLATYARIGSITHLQLWNSGSGDNVIFSDNSEMRFREFSVGGNISTLAGNGSNSLANLTSSAASQGISYAASGGIDTLYFQVDPAVGTLYSGARWSKAFSRLDRTSGKWVDILGNGSTHYYDPTADGKVGNQIDFTGYQGVPLGYDGTNLYILKTWYNNGYSDNMIKSYAISNGAQSAFAGLTGTGNFDGFSVDGTATSASTVPDGQSSWGSGIWDAFGARLVANTFAGASIRSLVPGGAVGTVAVLPFQPSSFTYRHDASNNMIYYCAAGALYKYNVTTTTNTALTLPITKMKCTGHGLAYSSSRSSLVFPFTQDGIGGVAEYLNP